MKMVFKNDERSTVDDSFDFPYRHSKQVHSGVQLCPIAGWEGGESADKVHGGEKPMIHSSEKYCESNGIIATSDGLSIGTDKCDGKHLRSFDDELYGMAFKRARHANFGDYSLQNGTPLLGVALKEPAALAFECGESTKILSEQCLNSVETLGVGCKSLVADESATCDDPTRNLPNGISKDVHTVSEAAKWDRPTREPLTQFVDIGLKPDDLALSFYDRFPRKHVAVGPDHQVDIPSWENGRFTDSDDEHRKLLMGTPVLAMPDAGNMVMPEIVGAGRSDNYCNCIDKGSINCTKRHVAEARERTKRTIGVGKFAELGFHDMGEDVALSWTEEEEQLFQEVVLANPATLGKNFWNVLPRVFPSRSSKELVSYYFNVFMLRKRAEQNRSDPWNVDSDNDEWQESDDGEFTMVDSGQGIYYQSPRDRLEVVYAEEEEEDDESDDDEDDSQDDEYECEDGFGGPAVARETKTRSQGDFHYKSGPALGKSLQMSPLDSLEEQDAHDDSCTSYEGQHAEVDCCAHPFMTTSSGNIAADIAHHEECKNDLSNTCMPGPCDAKEWDVCYFSSSDKVDFLPTRYVIEEVIGKDLWQDERDDHGLI